MTMIVLALLTGLGFLLLIAGVRLLALVAAFTGGALGWCLGGIVHDNVVPEWSPAICAATASVCCAALAALFVKPAVSVGFAVAGTIIGLLFGGLLIERGIAPTAPLSTTPSVTVGESSPAASVRAARSGLTEAVTVILGEVRDSPTGVGRAEQFAGAGGRIVALARTRWAIVPAATRTFLLATTAAGGVMGLVLGLFFSRWATAGAASMLGSILFLGCGLPLTETLIPSVRCPESPAAWLLLGAATTLSGWAFQMRRSEAKKVESSSKS